MATNIFAQYAQPQRTVMDYMADFDKRDLANAQLQGVQRQNDLAKLMYGQTVQDAQAKANDTNAIRSAYQQANGDQNALLSILRGPGATPGTVAHAGEVEAANLKRQQVGSEVAKNTAQAGEFNANTLEKHLGVLKTLSAGVMANPTLDSATNALDAFEQLTGRQSPQDRAALQQIGNNPEAIKQWAASHALAADKLLPTIQTRNTGGTTDTLAVDPVTGQVKVTNSVKNTVSPDAQLSSDTSIKTTGMNNATSRANNAANISKDLTVAGIGPNGAPDSAMETTAQAIAKGQLPPPTGMALLNPRNQRTLARVMEINPDYDASTVAAKRAAATAFTSGPLGNALRSVSTANEHLNQLGELVDALGNGNTQVINKVGNFFATQTGDPKATNFDAIKNIVGQEVVKAIVAGGGGVGEREEAAKAFSTANSPAQLKGTIQHYRMVMGAQANNLIEQRRAAGLPDSTMPNYNRAQPANADLHSQADAIIRGGK